MEIAYKRSFIGAIIFFIDFDAVPEMAGTTGKKKSKKSGSKKSGMKKAQSMMSKAAKAWNASDKTGKYTTFIKKYFKEHGSKKKK